MGRFSLAAWALAILAMNHAWPAASAGTTVTVEGTTVVIHMQIEVKGLAGVKIKNSDTGEIADAAQYIQREVGRIWNEALKGTRLGDCLTFRLDLQIMPLKRDAPNQAGWHHVTLDSRSDNSFWQASGPDDQVPTLDNPFPFQRDFTGVWNTPEPGVLAHEIGHVLGLGDDYYITCTDPNDRSTCKTTGKKPTGQGIEGLDMDTPSFTTSGVGIPDPSAVFRVIEQVRAAGLLPSCWKGKMKVAAQFLMETTAGRSDSWNADIEVVVSDKGVAQGTGTAHRASEVKFNTPPKGPPCPSVQAFTYGVTGEGDRQSLRLKFQLTGSSGPPGDCDQTGFSLLFPGSHAIPLVGVSRAEARLEVSRPGRSASIDAALDCVTCNTASNR